MQLETGYSYVGVGLEVGVGFGTEILKPVSELL